MGGPIVHAAVMMNPGMVNPLKWDSFYGGIMYMSGLFRMPTFFVISGFLAAIYVSRENWLMGRLRSIGIPLIAGWVLLVPLTIWLLDDSVWGAIIMKALAHDRILPPIHIWFLITLMVSAVLVNYSIKLINRVSAILTTLPIWMTLAVFTVLLIASNCFFHGAVRLGTEIYQIVFDEVWLVILRSPFFIVLYLFGFHIFSDCRIVALARDKRFILFVVMLLGVALVGYNLHTDLNAVFDKIVRELFQSIISLTASLAVFGIGMTINRSNTFANRLSDAGYSVYLLHVPMLGVVWRLFGHRLSGIALYILLTLGSLSLSLLAHELLIRPFALQRFIWNGKRMPRKSQLYL
jgi:glucan biosynthesis protein C